MPLHNCTQLKFPIPKKVLFPVKNVKNKRLKFKIKNYIREQCIKMGSSCVIKENIDIFIFDMH
jgi:hypothetical protein